MQKNTKDTQPEEMQGDIKELKDDVKEMQGDIKELKDDVKEMQGDIKELKEKVSHAATKEDMIEFKDAILHEIQGLREDVTIVTGYKDQIEDHETRIETLEKHIPHQN